MRKSNLVNKMEDREILAVEKENQIIHIQHRNWIIKYHRKDKRYSLYVKKAN